MIALMILRKTLRFWVTPTWFTTLLTCFRVLSKLLGQVGFLYKAVECGDGECPKHLTMACKQHVVNHLNITTVWPKKVAVSNQSTVTTRAPFLTFLVSYTVCNSGVDGDEYKCGCRHNLCRISSLCDVDIDPAHLCDHSLEASHLLQSMGIFCPVWWCKRGGHS